jgi:hypothetical protein
LFLAAVAAEDLECAQFDKNAHLQEKIYLTAPKGVEVKKGCIKDRDRGVDLLSCWHSCREAIGWSRNNDISAEKVMIQCLQFNPEHFATKLISYVPGRRSYP